MYDLVERIIFVTPSEIPVQTGAKWIDGHHPRLADSGFGDPGVVCRPPLCVIEQLDNEQDHIPPRTPIFARLLVLAVRDEAGSQMP